MPPNHKPAPAGFRWVFCHRVWHVRKGAYITRKDGKPFAFLVRRK